MQLDGVRHNLGMHSTEIEAARAYDKFARVRRILTIQKLIKMNWMIFNSFP